MNIENIVKKIKKETNNNNDITYRKKYVCGKTLYIIYNEPLTSSDKISDFIIRSLDKINLTYDKEIDLKIIIQNDIDNFKTKIITTYKDICYYLNYGFTIILIENCNDFIALETKRNLSRSISTPQAESTIRGPIDAFVEDTQTNIGLIRRRIKDNNLWIESQDIGKYTKTKVSIIYINNIVKKEKVEKIKKLLNNIDIDGIISAGTIKNLIEKENKSVFPTIISTERPDNVCQNLLKGKIAIMVDTSPFILILPATFNDFFLTTEDSFGKSINVSLTRMIRYTAFFVSLLTPAIYIAITTYNQEILPTQLLISFTSQRESVPFPAFIEALIMIISFEILRESDLRIPTFTSSALSIVGTIILGEAAVNAGIVSPIMIIVIAITSISALLFTEPEMINGLRWYRILFMLGASLMGIYGVIIIFIYYIIKMCSLNSFGIPYFYPYSPLNIQEIKNSIIKFPIKDLKKRNPLLSNNITKYKDLGDKQ